MGADLIMYFCAVPDNLSKEAIKAGIEMRLGQPDFLDLGTAMELFDYGYLNRFQDDWEDRIMEIDNPNDVEHYDVGLAPDALKLTKGKEVIAEALMAAAEGSWLSPGVRDADILKVRCGCGCGHDTELMYSGGMSWGDEPTETGPLLGFLAELDLASYIKSDLQHLADTADNPQEPTNARQ